MNEIIKELKLENSKNFVYDGYVYFCMNEKDDLFDQAKSYLEKVSDNKVFFDDTTYDDSDVAQFNLFYYKGFVIVLEQEITHYVGDDDEIYKLIYIFDNYKNFGLQCVLPSYMKNWPFIEEN